MAMLNRRKISGFQKLGQWVVKHQTFTIAFLMIYVVGTEVIENYFIISKNPQFHMRYDVIALVIMILFTSWVFVKSLEESETARKDAQALVDLRNFLSREILLARTWSDLASVMLRTAHQALPDPRAALYITNLTSGELELMGYIDETGVVYKGTDPIAINATTNWERALCAKIDQSTVSINEIGQEIVCIDLEYNDQSLGNLLIDLSGIKTAPDAQIGFLRTLSSEMAVSIQSFLLKILLEVQQADSIAEKQRIARDLHDTLAQNIGYLRLKLDQMTQIPSGDISEEMESDLDRLREIADEAYQQVRKTLDELSPASQEDFTAAMFRRARSVAERASLSLDTQEIGRPRDFPVESRKQVLYIFREGLHNIEKHARANQVRLMLIWLDSELIVKLSDDGVGIRQNTGSDDGHYGLQIMRERAESIGGLLRVEPLGGKGTEVTLWLPLVDNRKSTGS